MTISNTHVWKGTAAPLVTDSKLHNDFRLMRSSSESGKVCLITYRELYLVLIYVFNIHKIIPS
jgi:hypothetical protein